MSWYIGMDVKHIFVFVMTQHKGQAISIVVNLRNIWYGMTIMHKHLEYYISSLKLFILF